MSRIAKLPLDKWDPQLRAMTMADSATPLELGLMRMIAHTPGVAKGFVAFAGAMKAHRTLPDRLVELVRLRIAFHNQCRSCMAIRYKDAIADGVDEALVCSLEKPQEADGLSPAEKAALAYADLNATDHLAINEAHFEVLRGHFTEAQIVELGMFIALCIGFGRLGASWDMTEELPQRFRDKTGGPIAPWGEEAIAVR